ncbi:unnamed protein product [Calypogeia fissa]
MDTKSAQKVCPYTIRDIRRAIDDNQNVTLGPIHAYIVNFHAPYAYPRRFTYLACTEVVKEKGPSQPCMRTIDGTSKCDSLERGTWIDAYCFDLIFADKSLEEDCRPLQVAIFEARKSFLHGKSVGGFSLYEEDQQKAMVENVVEKMPYVEVIIQIHEGRPAIQRLSFLPSCSAKVGLHETLESRKKSSLCTPNRDADGDADCFSIPTGTFNSNFSGGSNSNVAANPNEFQELKDRVKEMEKLLQNMNIRQQM